MATKNDLVDFVTWASLENSLKGLKDMIDLANQRQILTPMATQTVS